MAFFWRCHGLRTEHVSVNVFMDCFISGAIPYWPNYLLGLLCFYNSVKGWRYMYYKKLRKSSKYSHGSLYNFIVDYSVTLPPSETCNWLIKSNKKCLNVNIFTV